MKTSRTLILRHLTMVALALGIALLSAGSAVPVALGYYVDGPVSAPAAWDRLAENAASGLDEEDPSATVLAATVDVLCADVGGLIAAIDAANINGEDDVINLNSDSVSGCTYTLVVKNNDTDGPNGLPSILPDGGYRVTINGNGATIRRISVDVFRIFHVSAEGDLTLNDLTITNGLTPASEAGGGIYNKGTLMLNDSTVSGNATGDGDSAETNAGDGGGVYNGAGAHLTLTSSTVSDNATGAGGNAISGSGGAGGSGGGIYSTGMLTATNSTVSGNATGSGGNGTTSGGNGGAGAGIHNAGTLTLGSSTVVSNTTGAGGSGSSAGDAGSGGGISNYGAVTVTNTIIANNNESSQPVTQRDCHIASGTVTSGGYNLVENPGNCTFGSTGDITSSDLQLGPLSDNGGPTNTHALLHGSPAIDHIPSGTNGCGTEITTDQRGVARPQDGDDNGTSTCDIGAYERRYVPLWTVTTTADDFGAVDDECSLREAIQAANTSQDFGGCRIDAGNHAITLTAGTYVLTIAGSGEDDNASGDLDITTDLVINGAGADTTVIDANYLDRVLHVHNGATVELRSLTLTRGLTPADGPGGGVYNAGGLTITSSQVVSNTTASGASSVGGDGGDGAHGGGIYNAGQLTVTNSSLVRGNTTGLGGLSTGGNGGAGGHGGGIYNTGHLTVEDSTVQDNATGIGGSVSLDLGGTGGIGGAGGDGGGIYSTGQLTITNSTVEHNTTGAGGAGAGSDGGAGGRGGGIFNAGHVTVTDNSYVDDNETGRGGDAALGPGGGGMGGDGGSGGGIYSTGHLTVTTSSTVEGNSTGDGGVGAGGNGGDGGSGGGIYSTSQLMITDGSSVVGNTTGAGNDATSGSGGDGGSGAGIYSTGQVTVTNSSLVGENTTGTGGTGDAYDGIAGGGGGIYNDAGTMTVTDSTVSNNSAALAGGGIENSGTMTVTNSTVNNNSAEGNGGGIYNDAGTLTVSNDSTISNNFAVLYGGGIYIEEGTMTVTNSTVSGNSAEDEGGGIYIEKGTVTLTDSTVSDNFAGSYGGGIENWEGTLTLNDSTVSNNSAEDGGGIENWSTLTLNNSTVSNNSAEHVGGGIDNWDGTLMVNNSTVSNNSAGYEGGGIYIEYGATLTLTNSTVSDNSAEYGGGISNRGDMTVTQSTVLNNSAGLEGGGIWNAGTTALIINSTISTNSADWGGGIYNYYDLDIRFTTIAGNSAVQGGASVYGDYGCNVTLLATIIAEPQGKPNCDGEGLTSTGGGFNRISDMSCQLKNADPDNDKENAVIQLLPLDDYGGPTLTYKPVANLDNEVVDIMPGALCLQAFDPDDAVDQRGKHRPSVGVRVEGVLLSPDDALCDAGAVELRTRVQRVCGPPLAHTNSAGEFVVEPEFVGRCFWPTIAYALQQAEDGDTIIISGVITETVTVSKSVTIEGPTRDEITPGTHMGIVQADRDQPDGSRTRGSVFTIPYPISVTIKNLNIRHGDADIGGGIKNGGLLTLEGVTIYDNAANWGGAIYNSGALTVENSSLLDNLGENGGAGIYNAAAGPDDDGLALWLPFNEAAGATGFADESGNELDASCSAPYCPTAGVDGRHANALQFDGTNDYAEIAITPDIDDLQQFTLATWVKLNSLPAGNMRFVTLGNEKAVLRYDDAELHFYVKIDGSFSSSSIRVPNVLSADTWLHVAGTYDGSTMRLYLDGAEQDTRIVSGTVATGDGILLSHPGETLDGLLDEVVLYDRTLSEAEIEALFYAGDGTARVTHATLADNIIPGWTARTIPGMPDDDGLALLLPFDESSGATEFADESGYGRDAGCSSPYCPTAGVAGRHAKALRFDGSNDYLDVNAAFDIEDNFTISLWANPDQVGVDQLFVGKHTSEGGNQIMFGIYNGKYYVNVNDASHNFGSATTGWQHLAVVAEKVDSSHTQVTVYKDGASLGSTTLNAVVDDVSGGKAWTIGQDWDSSARTDYYDGRLDELAIYSRALSEAEIELLYASPADGAYSVYAVDMDKDGDPDPELDVISASYNDDKIAWYENVDTDGPGTGNGSVWAAHIITTTADGARSVYVADVDGDGDLDALSASYNDDKIAWYENTAGDGTAWTSHTIVDINSIPDDSVRADGATSVFAVDVDGDDDTDVLSASFNDDKIAWYENRLGDVGCTPSTPVLCWIPHTISTAANGAQSVYAADVDGDGNVDVFSASNNDNKIAWYENKLDADGCISPFTPAACWSAHTISFVANGARSVYVADVDGDGDLDALSASEENDKIAWYENTSGDGAAWTTHIIVDTYSGDDRADGARSVYAADVDRDGDLDVLSASYNDNKIAWYENVDGDGTTWTAHTITTDANGARSVFAAFVDEDGNVDVLSASFSDDEITWYDNPIGAVGSSIYNANPAAGSVIVSGTILQSVVADNQCAGEVTTGGYNLLHGGTCSTLGGGTDITGDPELGPLRDNGGPTLTRAPSTADSPAVEAGPFEADCGVETDQRGKARPFDSPGGGGVRCDIGAVEYGADTLLVWECEEEECESDPDNLRFIDLQEALHYAMAGDVIAVEAGAYTGNFTAYKNVRLQHAGINVATLSQDQPVDVRAILQASERTIREQHRLLDETQTEGLSGTVLTIEAYEYPAGPTGAIAVTDDVTVTLRGLTIRHGLSRQGGGIYNVGHLYVYTSTISENAVVNELQDGITVTVEAQGGAIYNVGELTLEHSTLSSNQSEYYGGAIYNDGSDSGGIPATVEMDFSTIAENRAEKIGAQRVVDIKDTGFDPGTLTVDSGDHIQFRDLTPNAHTLVVDGEGCNLATIEVPRQGGGLSEPLICSVSDDPVTITVRDEVNASLSMDITVNALGFTPEAHTIYVSGGEITVHRSLLVKSSGSSGDNCVLGGIGSLIQSEGYNLADDDSCRLTEGTDLEGSSGAQLGPLQDNNAIDFVNNWISGYTYSHALKPGSTAMDRIPPDVCDAASQHTINIPSEDLDLTVQAGDIVQWTNTADSTVALDDGEANVNLIAVPAGGQSREVQFNEPGDYVYRVYANNTRAQIGAGTISVTSRARTVDQRGTVLPQRGTGELYRCDIGAYEFELWVVGQPLSRPPAAIGTQPPEWRDGDNTKLGLSYHAWSSATAQDHPLRPSPNDGDADLEPFEIVTLKWETDPDPASEVMMSQYGIVEWPSDPQIHVSGSPVQLTHDDVSDGFRISDAWAFEGRKPAPDDAGQLVSVGVFTRTALVDIAGDSYSVLQFVKGNQTNPTLKVQVVKTVDWNTPGVRDMRAERGVCEIGHEIRYRSYEDASGTLPGHEDPEGRPGKILLGDAFDGVRTEIDLVRVQNTVDGLILPAHIRDAREGPIIPILNTAPTQLSGDLVTGDHDLRIAWYRPDERDVAWPVKTIGYRCDWPADPPEIVIASELGSEIGGQPVLNPEGYSDVTVYHQPDPDEPGYNPNDEHALLASSNLGNSAPALYALRTDLADQPYALLKYRDPREDDQTKIAVYKVVLTRDAEEITDITSDPGTITLLASTGGGGVAQTNLQSQPSVTVRVGDGELPPGGDVTVLVEALGASNLRSVTIKVSYDPDELTPTACTTNRLDFVEALYNLQIDTDGPAQPFRTVHMRASLDAGTDAQYEWDFDDGTTRIAGDDVSHVYGAVGTYDVTVTASNGVFADVTATTQVTITEDAVPGSLDDDDTIGCRIETDGELTIELKSRNKHGLSGSLLLTEVTFEATGDPPAEDTETSLGLASISLFGPGYEDLAFNITAGNPVFAPTPLRGLLDIQPCEQTQATDVAARPFWKDFKGMLWARAAGDMDMLYFYPLQPGFHLTDNHAESLGLVDEDGELLPVDQRVGQCVPWMDKLSGGQTETVPYAIPHTIATDAAGARSVYAADVDGDGDVDVLSASFDDDKIAWYENVDKDGAGTGDGTTWTAHTISTNANGATSVYAADVDDDGDLDVLSASANDDKIAWYENDGTPANGGWTAHTLVTGANGARSVYAADVDGDGNLDVLSASENNDEIVWYENGNGWFKHVIADDADGATSVYAADVDDDGDVDVVSASFNDDQIAWYENQLDDFECQVYGNGCWTAHIISTDADGAQSVYAADVDGDDDLDILSASENDDKIAWYENTDGTGAFGPEQVITTDANGAVSVYAADVDGDGDLDALSASYYGDEIAWYENDGTPADGGWTAHTLSTDADGARSVYAADVDGDGKLDVLSASENDDKIAWYQNQSVRVLPVAYHVDWPDLPPLLSVGETVYERAKSGISGVANQLAVSRIYDDLAPGAWDNVAQKIVIEGAEVQRSLAQLIDPIGEARVEVGITINDNPSLPEEIKTVRLLFGGGLAIVGTTDNEITLPFALRTRITFDDIEGELIFKGYYDGASPEYIKGDPLLLLNVMSKSDKQRLEDMCQSGSADCQKYLDAVEELYHKTRNPRQVDLCRTAAGELYADDPDPAANQGAEQTDISSACSEGTYRDGVPDHALLIGVQDTNDDGLPEPYEGLGKGKALTAGNAAGTGYITVVYNNDDSLGGLPVSLQVIKVGCTKNHLGEDSTYRGNLLVVKSDNLFDEKLTLRHTGDFGGQPDNFEFEWYIAEVDETAVSPAQLPPSYPWKKWTRLEPGADDIGPEITIEGANPTTLSDNWLIMRYKGCPVCGNQYRYSAFAGDPSAKPSEVRGQLAEGWIKRVVGALNPFDTRVDDFVSTPVNTAVDMIRQAGPRYEGPVAMSNDPDVLNSMGLIEAYQTVLDRGRDLSIDSNINHQGANAALMNVTSRIGGLYMLLGNEAYMDALDPTVGLGTSSALDSRAPAIFAFMNQFRPDAFGLIDEELGLLRGRDETLGGVAAAPTYNRLTWNFTNGDGEVAYVLNYNIKDMNQDGFVNEADAAIMYPQGHGDAWGHHLTAITKYYELLRHPNYTWVPRAEPVSVGGAPVVVDYYDERRFATAAGAKARMGAEIVSLTYRQHYSDPDDQEYVDSHVDASDNRRRAWGVADWARRAGQGAYFDWVMANAIIPPEDDRYSDVRKIDRTTVLEIGEIADQYRNIQGTLDSVDQGLNPLGLAGDAVLFDLDPSLIAGGVTHFEQVYERALASVGNTLALFNYANEVKIAQRASQDARRDFVTTIIEKDTALINSLIELFGYPYDADIGVNGTYPEGYDGPDIYNYDLWDRIELTDAEKRCSDRDVEYGHCAAELTTFTVEYWPLDCLGNYVEYLKDEDTSLNEDLICPHVNLADEGSDKLEIEYRVGVGLDKGRGRFKPASWPEDGSRKAVGDIQNAIQSLNQARLEYEKMIQVYQNHVIKLDATQKKIKERADMLKKKEDVKISTFATFKVVDAAIAVAKEWALVSKKAAMVTDKAAQRLANCPPTNNGFANDMMSALRCGIEMSGLVSSSAMRASEFVAETIQIFAPLGKDIIQGSLEIDLFKDENDWELKNMGRSLGGLLLQEKELRLALYLAKDKVNGAQGDYDQVLQRGFRKLQELIRLRKRWAGQISEQRYSDMAYRIFQNDALQKYRRQFDLAQQYVYLTAAAYDYEVNLSRDDPAIGDQFLRSIVGARTLGEIRRMVPLPLEPIVGSGGLADPLGRMKDNFEVLKGQMGFNNPQTQASRFSLRHELLRLRDSSDAKWRHELQRYYTPDIYSHDDVARLAKRPYGETGLQPGLVIPFGTNVTQGLNFFGRPLGPGDGAYNATQFVTKIASVGVWFEGYDTDRLARMPYAYLLPAGSDVIRPRDTSGTLRYWNITEQLLPVPHVIGQADMEDPTWIPRNGGLDGQLFAIKPYASFQAFPYSDTLTPDELNTDTRLIGRSVWNTEWVLVIPGATLLSDPQVGLERFIEDVDDIYVYFQTYAYAGN